MAFLSLFPVLQIQTLVKDISDVAGAQALQLAVMLMLISSVNI